jgi:hypothetical protein
VLSDPAAVSDHLAMSGGILLPSRFSTLSARGSSSHEAQSLHLRYGLSVALPTLSSCRYLHQPKARFPVRWLSLLPVRESHPLEAPSLAWRAEVGAGQIIEQDVETDAEPGLHGCNAFGRYRMNRDYMDVMLLGGTG